MPRVKVSLKRKTPTPIPGQNPDSRNSDSDFTWLSSD